MESINWTLDTIGIYLVAINLVTAGVFYWDKRRAQLGSWRNPDKTI